MEQQESSELDTLKNEIADTESKIPQLSSIYNNHLDEIVRIQNVFKSMISNQTTTRKSKKTRIYLLVNQKKTRIKC
jgi:hypothetical protein